MAVRGLRDECENDMFAEGVRLLVDTSRVAELCESVMRGDQTATREWLLLYLRFFRDLRQLVDRTTRGYERLLESYRRSERAGNNTDAGPGGRMQKVLKNHGSR